MEGTVAGSFIIRLLTSLLQKANVSNPGKLIIQGALILAIVGAYSKEEKRMKELGVGIIGTGWVSDEYIRSFEMQPAHAGHRPLQPGQGPGGGQGGAARLEELRRGERGPRSW